MGPMSEHTRDPLGRLTENLFTLQRIGNAISAEANQIIDALFEAIVADLQRIDPTAPALEKWRKFRTEQFIAEVERRVTEVFPTWERSVRDGLAVAGRAQGKFAEGVLVASLGAADAVVRTPITQNLMRAILREDPFEGALLREWAEGLGAATVRRVRREVRLGMVAEESIPDLVRRIRGSQVRGAASGFVGGIYQTTTRDAEAIVRTAVNHVSNRAMAETYKANETILAGVRFTATLDDRTCFVAGTGVLTPDGYRPIEQLCAGDVVIGGSRTPRRVEGTKVARKYDMARVTLSTGEVVECTADHLWLAKGRGWVEAGALNGGEELAPMFVESGDAVQVLPYGGGGEGGRRANHPTAARPVTVARVERFTRPTTVYDIQVERDHSFIVAGVVVHNSVICGSLDGRVWPVGSPEVRTPPLHINCILGDSHVLARSGITGASKRWFDGEVIVFKTASGRELTCTPNHPVLTDHGWVPARLLNVGSHVVCDGGREWEAVGRGDGEDTPALMHKVAEAFLRDGGMLTMPVPVAPEDFHGDGGGSEVAVVRSDCFLGYGGDAPVCEHGGQFHLLVGPVRDVLLSGLGTLALFLERARTAARSFVGRCGDALDVFRSGSRHPSGLLLASVANVDTVLLEQPGNDARGHPEVFGNPSRAHPVLVHRDRGSDRDFGPAVVANTYTRLVQDAGNHFVGDSEAFGDRRGGLAAQVAGYDRGPVARGELVPVPAYRHAAFLEPVSDGLHADAELARDICGGSTGPVFLDDVIDVQVQTVSDHVYNLETGAGFYAANGIITHNCRSLLVPEVDWDKLGLEPPPDGERFARDLSGVSEKDMERKVSARRRTGDLGKRQMVPSSTTFSDWLKRQPNYVQERVLKSPKRARLFREGKVTLRELVTKDGNIIPLGELET